VENLERNGSNLQHFSREVARYFRNLLVAKVADAKLIAASPQERERLAEIAAPFSEEDLTRYLQLSLDLFSDLQASLQPRFHLELGLIRMVQAGRLVTIEEALANLGGAPPPPPAPNIQPPKPASNIQHPTSNSAPTSDQEWKQRLHTTLMEIGMAFTADGVEHSTVAASASELRFTTPEEFRLGMKPDDINQAVRRILGRPMKIEIVTGAVPAPAASSIVRKAPESETSARALANPEVKRFQEIFGGQIRTVRNLKE
jgi:DNA polymerase-3 subunit gamma/tau